MLSIKKMINIAGAWVRQNPALSAAAVTALAVSARQGIRIINNRKEKMEKQLTIYDSTLRANLRLKRPITSSQAVELAARVKRGDSVGEAAGKMGLLK